jgi:hypothetical protein
MTVHERVVAGRDPCVTLSGERSRESAIQSLMGSGGVEAAQLGGGLHMKSMRFALGISLALLLAACGKGHVAEGPGEGGPGDGLDASSGGVDTSVVNGLDAGANGSDARVVDSGDNDTSTSATADGGAVASCVSLVSLRPQSVGKVDLLFMIDNSSSMGDKQALLAQAVPDMINRLVSPNCVDGRGNTLGPSSNGSCASGQLEFPPVNDMHVGIVTSSLGGRGATTTCDPAAPNPTNPNLPSHNDDRGELINRGGDQEAPLPKAGSPLNFLAWYPSVPANQPPNHPAPPVPAETFVGDPTTPGTLIGDFTQMVAGVHEHGCGFEAQNEAWYRFLVQPDPFASIQIDLNNHASLQGMDAVILQQRRAFLRPDSLLAVIVVTDENEEVANPMSIGGEGWLFETAPWPGSPSGGGAPEGTIECRANPEDPSCTSCAFQSVTQSANFSARCPNDPPNGTRGYLDPSDDNVNVRFFHQKQRMGVFAGYPVSRYIRGLTSPMVPDRTHEVDGTGNYVGDQDQFANCVNPIFATNLPTDPNADLCHLTPGPRTADLVYYAAIAGVPHQLLQAQPGDPECSAGVSAADCPQKTQLRDADWLLITGKDPENYDFTGADFHMLESEDPRSQSACPPASADNCDPINGRERDTQKGDLQYACTFPLAAPKDCTQMQFAGACDCDGTPAGQNTPLCQKDVSGAHTTTQIAGKAYPSIREMVIAHAMANRPSGVQGIVSSLCPIHPTAASPSDPVFGYRPAANAIIGHLKNGLGLQCLPANVCLTLDGVSQCVAFVTLPTPGPESQCDAIPGLSVPSADLLQPFQAAQHQRWVNAGGASTGLPDPATVPICLLHRLSMQQNLADFGPDGTCLASADPGWCYVSGGACPEQIIFTANAPAVLSAGATVNLQCPTR